MAAHSTWQVYLYHLSSTCDKPKPDADIQGNNDILQDMVRRYKPVFTGAEFWGGTQGADGQITFRGVAIKDFWGFDGRPGDRLDLAKISGPQKGRCKRFPLEVGYCYPDQIDTHLMDSRCVARFPYGYDLIIFLEDLTDRRKELAQVLGLEKVMQHYPRVDAAGQLSLL